MKILILFTPRSGSTNLLSGLSKYFNLQKLKNPFAPDETMYRTIPTDFDWYRDNDNFIVKQNPFYRGYDDTKKLLECFAPENVILLSRRDITASVESYSYMLHNFYDTDSNFRSWSTKYVWEKTPNYEECEVLINKGVEIMNRLSVEYSIPIRYYEDIYLGNQREHIENLNLGIDYDDFKKYISLENKQRQYNVKRGIL
jgi:hypothetical protein